MKNKWFHFLESQQLQEGEVHIIESSLSALTVDPSGSIVDKNNLIPITVLRFGKSPTPPHFVYTREAMQSNLHLFEGARVYMNREGDRDGHKTETNKKVPADIVGYITAPQITNDGITASMSILPSAGWFKENLQFLSKQNRLDVYQLSIDAGGKALLKDYQGETLPHPEILSYLDVDVVPRGAMGGEFQKMLESLPHNLTEPKQKLNGVIKMNKTKQMLMTLFTLLYPTFLESKNVDYLMVNENELFTHLLEADKAQSRFKLPDGFQLTEQSLQAEFDKFKESLGKPAPAPAPKADLKPEQKKDDNPLIAQMQESQKQLQIQLEKINQLNRKALVESKMLESKLPQEMQLLIRDKFSTTDGVYVECKESDVDNYITTLKSRFEKTLQTLPDVKIIRTEKDKVNLGVFGFFAQESAWGRTEAGRKEIKEKMKDIPAFISFREAYSQMTGDRDISGVPDRQMRESINTSDWAYMVADNANIVLLKEYGMMGLDEWRKFCDIVPLSNFKTNHRVRYGGYGNLPTVGQRATYPALSSPTDEEATYAATKKGGLEEISREMILGDDVGFIRGIPKRLAYAAARTIHETVFALINPAVNATIYDNVALYHSNHLNTGTVAMGSTGAGILACSLRMAKYLEKNSSKRLGFKPKYVVYPTDLRSDAHTSIVANYGMYNETPTLIQSWNLEGIEAPFWTDATDYCVIANPAQVIGLEVGFVNNKQDPEIFVSDIPNVGSFFTNDVVTMKIRHEYGAAITDWRAFDGQIVAG